MIESILNAIPLPAVLIDQTERIIGANPEARTLLGQQIINRHFATILRQPSMFHAIETCLRDRNPLTARFQTNDGAQDTSYDVTCRYVKDIGAVEAGAVLVSFVDTTHMEQAGQMRRDFVANVSHELRTPLTALIGFIETLRGPAREDPAARDRFLTIMEGEASRMNRLIADLLSLSRVEAEGRVRPTGQVNLTLILQSIVRTLTHMAEQTGAQLSLSVPEEEIVVIGDEDQVQQVFTNLIENAIKYGGDCKVDIILTTQDRDLAVRGPSARVQVIDHGPGIDPVHLPRLTERFYRGDAHRSRALGGTGLGLAIVKHIINRHRGRLRVESELGQGSVFTVILPR
ncbi:MAG: ATP-binding protein [Paracoccaceae bacterium]